MAKWTGTVKKDDARGRWEARVRFTTSDGKRKETRINTEKKAAAIDARDHILRELSEFGPDEYLRRRDARRHPLDQDPPPPVVPVPAPDVPTLGKLVEEFRTRYAKAPVIREDGKKVEGMKSWEWVGGKLMPDGSRKGGQLQILLDELGRDLPLSNLTFERIAELKARRLTTPVKRETWKSSRERSWSNVNRLLSLLRRIVKVAMRKGWMHQNPFTEAVEESERLIVLRNEQERRRILSPAEERRLLQKLDARSQLPITILLDTGLRFGEMASLRWSAVNLKDRKVGVFASKTETGREVPMTGRLRDILTKERKARSAGPDDPIVTLTYTVIHNDFRAACAAAKISDLRLHDLRHTRATRWIQGGLSESEVSFLIGHSPKSHTTRRYINPDSHTIKRAHEAEARFARANKAPRQRAGETVN